VLALAILAAHVAWIATPDTQSPEDFGGSSGPCAVYGPPSTPPPPPPPTRVESRVVEGGPVKFLARDEERAIFGAREEPQPVRLDLRARDIAGVTWSRHGADVRMNEVASREFDAFMAANAGRTAVVTIDGVLAWSAWIAEPWLYLHDRPETRQRCSSPRISFAARCAERWRTPRRDLDASHSPSALGTSDDQSGSGPRRRHRACEPAAAPLPTCATRTTRRIGAASRSLRWTEIQRLVISRAVLR
jgi:hypothetical protein